MEIDPKRRVGLPARLGWTFTLRPVGPEVQAGVVEEPHQLGEPVHHVLALAELFFVVEVGQVDDALETVGLGELGEDLVDLLADLLVPLKATMSLKLVLSGTSIWAPFLLA